MNWQPLLIELLETTTEYIRQHSTPDEEETDEEQPCFYIGFRMNMQGKVECDVDWPNDLPQSIIATAMAALLVNINKGWLSSLINETVGDVCEHLGDEELFDIINKNYAKFSQHEKKGEVVPPSEVLGLARVDRYDVE